MTIVRTDHDVVFAGILEHVRQIVIRLACDIDPIIANDVPRHHLVFTFEPFRDLYRHIRNPLCAYFDEPEAQCGKFRRDAVVNDGVKRRKNRHLEAHETVFAFKELYPIEAPRRRVYANWQVRLFGFLVQWEKKWMAEPLVIYQTAHE